MSVHSASPAGRLLTPATLAQIDRLELLARTAVNGFMSGMHRSSQAGSSTEFAEHRSYVPGDDIRRVDWRVFGRSDRLYVKTFQAETNADVVVALDCSRSMSFASAEVSKLRYGTMLAACFSHLARRQRDRFGAMLFNTDVHKFSLPASVPGEALMRLLEEASATGTTDLKSALASVTERLKRRAMVFVISDFYAPPDEVLTALGRLAQSGHEVTALHVLDPGERALPWSERGIVEDLETGQRMAADPVKLNADLAAAVDEHVLALERACTSHGMDYYHCDTALPLDGMLRMYLERRKRARVR